MKLYIPTCTLNFNNIFSTESISPAAFYQKREFGNKRYYKVEANSLDNVVLLYSKYPHFSVAEGDIENYPLVIEIDTEDYAVDKFKQINAVDGVSVYVSQSTIYLNPFHTNTYFRSWQDRQSTITKADQSLENKYSKLYSRSFVVHKEKGWSVSSFFTEKDYFDWNNSYIGSANEIPLAWNDDDTFIDRLKGAVVCYLIGSNMGVSKEVGRLRQLARKMRNTLSAIVNSPDKRPTETQDNTLLSYIQEFNAIYGTLDENSLYNDRIINQRLVSPSTGLDKETIIKVLKDLNLEDAFKRQLHLKPVYDANELYSCLDSPTMSPSDASYVVTERLFNSVKHIENNEKSRTNKNKLTDLISFENNHIQVIDTLIGKGTYINKLINSLIRGEYKKFMNEHGTEELLSIAFVGGGKLKEYMPAQWEGSPYQAYVNGLLANMQQGDSFDLFSVDNEILQSFAVFCQKGDEIDRLNDYMLQCGFSEYRYALGLYGATRGFASLPKTFTSSLIDGEKNYYAEYFKVLYKWLFGIEFQNLVLDNIETISNEYESLQRPISSKIMDNISQIEPKPSKQDAVVKAVAQTALLEDAVQNPKAFMFILDSFPRIKSTKAFKNLEKAEFADDTTVYSPSEFRGKIYRIVGKDGLKSQRDKIDKAIELESKRQDPEAFLKILDNFLSPKDAAYKKIASLINAESHKNRDAEEKSLFTKQEGIQTKTSYKSSLFISDNHCWDFIQSLIPEKLHKEVHRDLEWFQKEYEKGNASQYYANASRENHATIESFIRYLSRKKYASSINISSIEDYLRRIYVR